jgi:hypothetical protein
MDLTKYLCHHDERSPNYEIAGPKTGDHDCSCDSCFYGKHELAEVALQLLEALERMVDSSACTNKCDPSDMSCDSNFARKAISNAKRSK